jgi:hypothetical protein
MIKSNKMIIYEIFPRNISYNLKREDKFDLNFNFLDVPENTSALISYSFKYFSFFVYIFSTEAIFSYIIEINLEGKDL